MAQKKKQKTKKRVKINPKGVLKPVQDRKKALDAVMNWDSGE